MHSQCGIDHVYAAAERGGTHALLGDSVGELLRGKVVVAEHVEVARQVHGLGLDEGGEEGDGGGLAPARRQADSHVVELLAQLLAAVLALGAAQHAAQQRRVQALGRAQAPLDLAHRHLVLGGAAEEGEAAGYLRI